MTQPPGNATLASLHRPSNGPKNTNGRAHFPDDIVGRDTVDLLGSHSHGAARAFHLRAEVSENLEHVIRVAQVGHAVNDTRLASQQCRGENR